MVRQIANPYKEAVDIVREMGGEALRLCYQCGLCTGACPWNVLKSFPVRKLIHEVQLGLVDFESEDMWTCVTCGNCVQQCPRGVEIIDLMRAMRRTIVGLGVGPVPDSLRVTMKNLAGTGNPWGEPTEKRADWAQALNVKPFSNGTQLLYFPCCTTAYDSSVSRIGKATATILQKAGIDFGILGSKEACCGESARKAGDEDLFQRLVQENMAAFAENGIKNIVVSSPHCYYSFKNEYPMAQNGLQVTHSTQFLAGLIRDGKLKFSKEVKKRVAYHDPCYLGRHSGIFDEPREILSSIPGVELVELPNHHEDSICCGGGGGQVWMDTKPGERLGELRAQQALDVGAEVLALACPYCMLMFEGCLTQDVLDRLELRDITELVAEAM